MGLYYRWYAGYLEIIWRNCRIKERKMLKTVSSITNAIGALNYKGTWDASTNSPTLTSSVGTKGDYYVVSVAGSTTLNGISTWYVGDWAAFNGSVWQRLEGGVDDPAPSVRSNSTTGVLQVTGPAAGATRVMTVPDANFTAAITNAGQTFSGNQIVEGDVTVRRSSGDYTGVNATSGGTDNPLFNFNMNDGSPRYRFNMNSDVDIKFETIVGGGWGTAWQVDRVTRLVYVNSNDLKISTAGKGVIMTNAAGTVTKRVRLNDAGNGLVFENP
jgi:hypothetical protein